MTKRSLTIQDCYTAGYDCGHSLASWQDMPEIGTELPREIDYVGVGTIETIEDQLDAWDMLLSAADENCRQFSPFEFTAHAINLRDEERGEGESEAGWEAFERGMRKAFDANRRKRFPIRQLRKEAKESA